MKKEDVWIKKLLKQFKTGEELYFFLSQIHKRGIGQILEGELDSHLEYDKHQDATGDNVRTAHSKKKIKKNSLACPRFKCQVV
jgi:transposase-like protein